jgi:hypothetical protein
MSRIGSVAPGIVVISLAITATAAYAAATRAEYVARVDPICRAANPKENAVVRALERRVKQLHRHGVDTETPAKRVIRIAVRYYDRLAEIQRDENAKIAMVTPAPGDESIVAEWLQARTAASDFFQRGVHVFAHGRERRGKKLIGISFKREFKAELLVQDFGFKSCAHVAAED